ncbi:DUF3238 domain-containing protein [Paenibacillus popilliae]|nr:DUF3238 domain-containing protein [Paenibacillus popilliae]
MSTCEIKIKVFIPEAKISNPLGPSTFDGDNRGFSYDGSYRIAQYIKVDLDDLDIVTNMAMTGTTCENVLKFYPTEVAPSSVETQKKCKKASADKIKLEDIRIENDILHFTAIGAASNPLVALAPDIDYKIYVSVRKNGRVCVTGSHDGFPNYEVWKRVNYGTPINIYSYNHGTESAWALGPPMDKDIAVGTCS